MLVEDLYTPLIAWAEALTGIEWYRAGQAWEQGATVGELRITTVRNPGHDYEDAEDNPSSSSPGQDDLLLRMRGQRELVVEFRIESIYQTPPDTAQHLLELLRVRAGRSSARALLRDTHGLDLSFASAQPLQVVELNDENGHRVSVATLDVTFIGHFAESDEQAAEDTYIEKAAVTNKLTGVPSGAKWSDEELS